MEGIGVDRVEPGAADGEGLGGGDDDGGEDLEGGGGLSVAGVGMSGRSTKGVSAAAGPAVAIVWRAATA